MFGIGVGFFILKIIFQASLYELIMANICIKI